ncbi:MAG: ParB/Srx family N-terminal domain-containing protein [Candidatus Omnitrophota bacterium]
MTLNLTQIILDPQLNTRIAGLDLVTIAEYAESMATGDIFPPLEVFTDGESYWLVDGFHRMEAMKQTGITETAVTLHQGTWREAKLFSFQVNAEHGKRRTNADKRRAVMQMLQDDEWVNWSDREIARRCKVTHPLVAAMREIHRRETLTGNSSSEKRTYRTKHNTISTMQTANIGKSENEAELESELDNGYVDLLLDETEPTNAEVEEIELSPPKIPPLTNYQGGFATPENNPPQTVLCVGLKPSDSESHYHLDEHKAQKTEKITKSQPDSLLFVVSTCTFGKDSSKQQDLEKMIQQLKTTVYKAVIRIFKQLEHDDLIKGNGYYVAQKVADFTKQELLSRWKQVENSVYGGGEVENETQP